ncbi:MAG: hypothetical protein HEEMFOPI_00342 [Holosporales bacterium]
MRKKILLGLAIIGLTNDVNANFFSDIQSGLGKGWKYFSNSVQQNPNVQNVWKFAQNNAGSYVQAQLNSAQNYINNNGGFSNLQTNIQNAYNSNGINGAINQVESDVRNFAPGIIDNAKNLAQQQQSQIQTAYTKDQMNQVVQAMTTMDQKYGTQVQSINPSWRQAYAQAQVNLYNASGNSPIGKTYTDLCQRMLQAVPVLVQYNGKLNPSDNTWQQLVDNTGAFYTLDGTPVVQQTTNVNNGNTIINNNNNTMPLINIGGNTSQTQQQIQTYLTPAQIASAIQTAVKSLSNIYSQYGAKLAQYDQNFASSPFAQTQGLAAGIFTSYQSTLTALQAANAASNANITAILTLANNQIAAIPTIVMAQGALCPSDATWSKLTDGMGGYYSLSGSELSS